MLYQEGCEVYNARISNAYMDDEIKKIDPKIDVRLHLKNNMSFHNRQCPIFSHFI